MENWKLVFVIAKSIAVVAGLTAACVCMAAAHFNTHDPRVVLSTNPTNPAQKHTSEFGANNTETIFTTCALTSQFRNLIHAFVSIPVPEPATLGVPVFGSSRPICRRTNNR